MLMYVYIRQSQIKLSPSHHPGGPSRVHNLRGQLIERFDLHYEMKYSKEDAIDTIKMRQTK